MSVSFKTGQQISISKETHGRIYSQTVMILSSENAKITLHRYVINKVLNYIFRLNENHDICVVGVTLYAEAKTKMSF